MQPSELDNLAFYRFENLLAKRKEENEKREDNRKLEERKQKAEMSKSQSFKMPSSMNAPKF